MSREKRKRGRKKRVEVIESLASDFLSRRRDLKKISYDRIIELFGDKFKDINEADYFIKVLENKGIKVDKKREVPYIKELKDDKPKINDFDEPAQIYLNEISKFEVLSKEEQFALGKELKETEEEVVELIFSTDFFVFDIYKRAKKVSGSTRAIYKMMMPNAQLLVSEERIEVIRKHKHLLEKLEEYLKPFCQHPYNADSDRLKKAISKAKQIIRNSNLAMEEYRKIAEKIENHYNKLVESKQTIKEIQAKYGLSISRMKAIIYSNEGDTQNYSQEDLDNIKRCIGAYIKTKYIEKELLMDSNSIMDIGKRIKTLNIKVETIKEKLIQGTLRLVIMIAGRYAKLGFNLFDLIQEGNLGLVKATRYYDYNRGISFASYASWWIKQAILQYIHDSKMIKIPIYKLEQIAQDDGSAPDIETIKKLAKRPISLDSPVGDNENARMLDFIKDENSDIIPAFISVVKEEINTVLNTLPKRERDIIIMRFGLNGMSPHTLEEIGYKYKLSRERVRQIEKKAIQRLRQPSKKKRLKDLL